MRAESDESDGVAEALTAKLADVESVAHAAHPRGAQALHTLTSSLIDQQSTIVDLTKSQARVGLASELDVKSASAQLAQTRALLPQYDQQAGQAMNGLAYLIGETPGALDAELAAPSAIPPGPPTIPVGLPS